MSADISITVSSPRRCVDVPKVLLRDKTYDMAKAFSQTFNVDLPLQAAIRQISSEEFLTRVALLTEPLTYQIKVSDSYPEFHVDMTRKFPLELSGPLAKLAGNGITISESRDWAISSDQSATGTYTAKAVEQPITLIGTMSATAQSNNSCAISFNLELKCSIPFFGGMVEQQAIEYLADVIRLELSELGDASA